MKLLTAVSLAVMALSIAFDAKAYQSVLYETNSRVLSHIGINDTEVGSVRWASQYNGGEQHPLIPWWSYIKSYAKDKGQWNSESFKARQARGAEWMMANIASPFSSINSCYGRGDSQGCIDYSLLLSVQYHSVTLNGEFKEWYTASTIKIDRHPVPMCDPTAPGCVTPTTMAVETGPLQPADSYTVWY